MAKRIGRWSPDTCECIVEYSWDDTEPDSTRRHNLVTLVNKCIAHSHLDNPSLWTAVMGENQDKNRVLLCCKLNVGGLELTDIGWGYDADRVLHVDVPSAKASIERLATIQSICDTMQGVGKVKVTRGR